MKAYQSLPEGYQEVLTIDLQKDKKTSYKVNGAALAIGLILLGIGHLIVPIQEALSGSEYHQIAIIVCFLLYGVLHELTHGAVMRLVGGKKIKFGFKNVYAYAGSETDYFDKPAYRLIGLTPVVLWGIILTVLLFLLPRTWFWVVWVVQIGNIAGSVADIYVTAKLWRYPDSFLARDTGLETTIYDRG